jgi:cyclopropane fatty-acyl-phospholipid synthase-like methyltransferase
MSRDFWENRYQSKDMPWEKGEASPGLVDFLAANSCQQGQSVCIPGCGSGHDVREFARAGFEAHGFDLAPSAFTLAMAKTKAAGLNAKFALTDFLHDEPPQKFDWLFEHTLFCAIQPRERDAYVRAVLRWLKPTGHYLAVNYIVIEGDGGPPWRTSREEQMERFSPHFDLIADWTPRSFANRVERERMFWWRRKAV